MFVVCMLGKQIVERNLLQIHTHNCTAYYYTTLSSFFHTALIFRSKVLGQQPARVYNLITLHQRHRIKKTIYACCIIRVLFKLFPQSYISSLST